jgi:hypothetical protein
MCAAAETTGAERSLKSEGQQQPQQQQQQQQQQ